MQVLKEFCLIIAAFDYKRTKRLIDSLLVFDLGNPDVCIVHNKYETKVKNRFERTQEEIDKLSNYLYTLAKTFKNITIVERENIGEDIGAFRFGYLLNRGLYKYYFFIGEHAVCRRTGWLQEYRRVFESRKDIGIITPHIGKGFRYPYAVKTTYFCVRNELDLIEWPEPRSREDTEYLEMNFFYAYALKHDFKVMQLGTGNDHLTYLNDENQETHLIHLLNDFTFIAKELDHKMISFIISIYNQLDYVKYWIKIFDWIAANQCQDFEVVIADDNSNDGILDYVKSLKRAYKIRYFWMEKEGFHKSETDHRAAEMSSGKWLYFLDADTFIDNTTIPTIKKLLETADINTAFNGSRYRFNWDDIKDNFTMDFTNVKHWNDMPAKKDIPPASYVGFSGSNYLISRDLYFKSGGYPIDFDGYGYDDYCLVLKVLSVGGTIKAANEIKSYHIMHGNQDADPKSLAKLKACEDEKLAAIRGFFPKYLT